METRRDVLKAMGAVAAGGVLGKVMPVAQAQGMHRREGIRFGAQLNAYPIDPKDFSTVMAAIEKAKAIGYEGFETGFRNFMGHFYSPEVVRGQIAATGMTFFGIHMFLQHAMYDPTTLIAPSALYEKVARGGAAVGAKNVIASGAAAADMEQLKAKVAGLNVAAKFCKELGLGFAYHNEEPESGSKIGELDYLYSNVSEDVKFLFDVGHLYNVGGDVVAFTQKYHAKLLGLHLRDYRDHTQVVLGTGTLPLRELAEVLEKAHWRGWVECEEERLDGVKHGDEYLKPSFAALRAAFAG